MLIRELSKQTGLPAKTIRYYESVGLLPPPHRSDNNYRQYSEAAVERIRFIVNMRAIGLSLAEINRFLVLSDNDELLCEHVQGSLDRCIGDLEKRIAELQGLRQSLSVLRQEAGRLPPGKTCGPDCACHIHQITAIKIGDEL